MALALDTSVMLATVLGSILFGLYTFIFVATTFILVFRRRRTQRLNKPLLAVSVLMYFVALMHVVAAIMRTLDGFIAHRDNPGPVAFFLDTSSFSFLFKISFYIAQTVIGDAFVIYRLWIVWSGDKRVVVPGLICLLADTVCGIQTIVSDAHASPTTPVFNNISKKWIASFYSLTLFTNTSSTILIALKIWLHERRSSGIIPLRSRTLVPVIVTVVESGAIYSTTLLALFMAYLANSWGHYIILDMMVQLIGIAFSLIILRIGLGMSIDETIVSQSVPPSSRFIAGSGHDERRHGLSLTMPMKTISVRVTETTVTDGRRSFGSVNVQDEPEDDVDKTSTKVGSWAEKAETIEMSHDDGQH